MKKHNFQEMADYLLDMEVELPDTPALVEKKAREKGYGGFWWTIKNLFN